MFRKSAFTFRTIGLPHLSSTMAMLMLWSPVVLPSNLLHRAYHRPSFSTLSLLFCSYTDVCPVWRWIGGEWPWQSPCGGRSPHMMMIMMTTAAHLSIDTGCGWALRRVKALPHTVIRYVYMCIISIDKRGSSSRREFRISGKPFSQLHSHHNR